MCVEICATAPDDELSNAGGVAHAVGRLWVKTLVIVIVSRDEYIDAVYVEKLPQLSLPIVVSVLTGAEPRIMAVHHRALGSVPLEFLG